MNRLAHTSWKCKYHIVFDQSSDGKRYMENSKWKQGRYLEIYAIEKEQRLQRRRSYTYADTYTAPIQRI